MAIKVAVRGGVLAWSRHNVGKKECDRDDTPLRTHVVGRICH